MRKLISLFGLVFLLASQLQAQALTDSNLPIVIIQTDSNQEIPDAPRIMGDMKIIYKGKGVRNAMADQSDLTSLNYNGRINIEVRGSSSQFLSKKQYSISTKLADNISNNNVTLLGMPVESDWILNGIAFDASLIRDYISYTLSKAIGEYAPRVVFCEVVINGDYRGLYFLQEKIKVDNKRVDIVKITPTDNASYDLTGGYIIKADKVTDEDPSAWTMSSYLGTNDVNFIHEFPKPSVITPQQHSYIQSVFEQLNARAQSSNHSFSDGYPAIIDVPSFLDFMLINELSANVDAYQFSTYFHKDKNAKLRAGPIWDLNLSYGNDLIFWGLDRSKTDLWQFDNGDNIGAKFWKNLFVETSFRCHLAKRWNELTQPSQPFNLATINTLIDETVNTISEAVIREESRWQSVGDHAAQIDIIKTFLAIRIPWMTNALGSFSNCSVVPQPQLVISKIMYQPLPSVEFPDSTSQEFIEITNHGSDVVNLTGVYFRGTGFVYQFQPGSILPPQGVIQLANNRSTFEQRNGFTPFGEFTRNLSNSGHTLALADGFGNVIDLVHYSNKATWPSVAANGSYLKLTDLNLDNNLASSWVASNEAITSTVITTGLQTEPIAWPRIYPNPVEHSLAIQSKQTIKAIHLYDMQGRLLETVQGDSDTINLLMNQYASGVYLLTIISDSHKVVRKVLKR